MKKSNSIASLAQALSKFQKDVENPKYDAKNPQYGSNYATLGNVINTIRKPLAENGLSYIQESFVTEDGLHVGVRLLLMHESGEFIEFDPLILPAFKFAKGGGKTYDAQSAGIGITYGRRYSLTSALGISSESDDDANGISGQQPDKKQPDKKPAQKKNYPPKQDKPADNGPEPTISADDLKAVNTLMSNYVNATLKTGETVDGQRAKLKDWLRTKVGAFDNVQFMTAKQAAQAKSALKQLINKQDKGDK